MFKVFFTIVLFVHGMASAWTHPASAVRDPKESWTTAYQRFQFQNILKFHPSRFPSTNAEQASVKYSNLDINQIPDFQKNDEEIQQMFEDVRNVRFLEDPTVKNFPRRISWLYPMDGCFARAEWVSHLFKKADPKLQFSRVFIFGDLNVMTKNSPYGSVSWWYHVAVIVRHEGKALVIDPSLDVTHPMQLADWVKLQVDPDHAKLAICSDSAHDPSSDCNETTMYSESDAYDDIFGYLNAERNNLNRLKRDPDAELGNNPPW